MIRFIQCQSELFNTFSTFLQRFHSIFVPNVHDDQCYWTEENILVPNERQEVNVLLERLVTVWGRIYVLRIIQLAIYTDITLIGKEPCRYCRSEHVHWTRVDRNEHAPVMKSCVETQTYNRKEVASKQAPPLFMVYRPTHWIPLVYVTEFFREAREDLIYIVSFNSCTYWSISHFMFISGQIWRKKNT